MRIGKNLLTAGAIGLATLGGAAACTTVQPARPAATAQAPAPTQTIIIHRTIKRTVVVQPPAQAPQSALRYAGTGTMGEAVYANGNTSGPFAMNVEAAYFASGEAGSFYAYSPVTGQQYLMTASSNGTSVVVTGGVGAEIQFSR